MAVYSGYDFCVVGSGPSGLTLAYKLLQAGRKVIMIERDARIGGLAKSYNYNGNIFDTGPKRFHTDDPIVLDFIKHVLQEDTVVIGRSTKVHFLNKFFEWPLQFKDVFKMSPLISARCSLDLMNKFEVKDPVSFHEYIRSKYGETLYSIFFQPYTSKFLRWDPEDLHSDWASTGINRTVIDSRIKSNTLMDLVKTLALPQKVETEFIYPKEGGFGHFFDKLFNLCAQSPNFKCILSDKITALEDRGNEMQAVTQNGETLHFDQLVWSGNLNDLSRITSSDAAPHMHYLNTIFYNIVCKDEAVDKNRAQWIYVSNGKTLTSRITCMKEFTPTTCRDGYYNMVIELTDSQKDPLYFKNPNSYTDTIIKELKEISFLKKNASVEDVFVNPVVDTYPIYHRRYSKDFVSNVKEIKKFSKKIHLVGRSGAFWYNNSDHSIRMSLDLSKFLLGQTAHKLDFRGYFGGVASRSETRTQDQLNLET